MVSEEWGLDGVVCRFCRRYALSERETAVVAQAAEGRSTKEVASVLHCSESSVQTYWRRIVKKTKYASRAEVLAALLRDSVRPPA